MANPRPVTIVTYNGMDGACAAAMALLRYSDAVLMASSAKGIGGTFAELAEQSPPPAEVHVCGVGVWCDWSELEIPARRLTQQSCRIFWYCGRRYLDDVRERFGDFATPVFIDAGTNTAALAKSLELTDRFDAHLLTTLAWFDPRVEGNRPEDHMTGEQAAWVDLIDAALSQYFKYQDRDPYLRAIRKLARNEFDTSDKSIVENFRLTGYKYVLQGRTEIMKRLRERIQRCGDVDRHVIITGESGVGKEHVAHLIRERSKRFMGPFVPINCALYAGSANLANSDLFGHVKGAFTGAQGDRRGKFVEADSGFLYLDEIGELPLEVQAKLLRVIEDGWVTPEGADRPEKHVDVRVLAATNCDLPKMIRSGAFRADLYHRLATLRIHVPPLRERTEDIGIIVAQRLDVLAEEGYKRTFTKGDYEVLRSYDWPGNVRQLIKVIERAVLLDMSPAEVIDEERALGELIAYEDDRAENGAMPASRDAVRPLKEVQQGYARHVWELFDRNYSAAARALGVNANTLRYTHLKE